jgi:hypothetical protein
VVWRLNSFFFADSAELFCKNLSTGESTANNSSGLLWEVARMIQHLRQPLVAGVFARDERPQR